MMNREMMELAMRQSAEDMGCRVEDFKADKNVAATLGTQNYARLRFGIGNDFPRGGQVDFVLGHFTDEDWKTMDERLKTAGEIIKSFCLAGIDITMNQFNKK